MYVYESHLGGGYFGSETPLSFEECYCRPPTSPQSSLRAGKKPCGTKPRRKPTLNGPETPTRVVGTTATTMATRTATMMVMRKATVLRPVIRITNKENRMNNNLTEIVFILDRSGSMQTLTDDTIGGFNSFIEKQKKEPGDAILTTVLFDDQYEILHDGVNLKDVKPLTREDYYARGMTAMMDAIGRTINTVDARIQKTPEQYRPGKVIFVITTDGYENASMEFSRARVKEMIQRQTAKYDWQFLFLGANMDAVSEAGTFGVCAAQSVTYAANSVGTKAVYDSLNSTISNYRSTGTIDASWKADIEATTSQI